MTAIDKNPKSLNFLSPINFRFFLRRAPNLNFEVQRVNIPGIRMGHIMLPGPILAVPEPGDHILYNELDIEFKATTSSGPSTHSGYDPTQNGYDLSR